MFDLVKDIIGNAAVSDDVIASGCVVLIIVLCVATIDLASQLISIFTRIK